VCGRFELSSAADVLARVFGLVDIPALEPRFNVAPMQGIFVVRRNGDARVGEMMRWGFVPAWAKEPSIGSRLINARCETIGVKPAFRNAFVRRRCLIPADSFYEWKILDNDEKIRFGYSGRKTYKQPVRVFPAIDNLFAFAGLWEHWQDPGGSGTAIDSCAIITTKANELLRSIHERMPVIVRGEDFGRWLNCGDERVSVDDFNGIFTGFGADEMRFHFVSQKVNKAGFDSQECVEEFNGEGGLFG